MIIEPVKIIKAIAGDGKLVFEFFAFFSRFEYSLKRSGFLRRGRNGRAEVDWDKYAKSLEGKFLGVENPEFQAAISSLTGKPPKTQIVTAGDKLDWSDTLQRSGEHDESYILRLVRTVRNNLFHGGKYPHPVGPIDEVARNPRLLEAGIVVLRGCLALSESVRSIFEETV